MFAAPSIPKVRCQVLRRLCVGAAEAAAAAIATLMSEGRNVRRDLVEYCDDVRRTGRAKACRFSAIDADLKAETGRGIAWLRAGMGEVGLEVGEDGKTKSGLRGLKISWNERRGAKGVALDGGRGEEGRILEYLLKKFRRENDAVNVQIVPDWKPLMAEMPSGMNIPVEDKWRMPVLSEEELAGMRAPPEDDGGVSSSEDEGSGREKALVGAFPATDRDYQGKEYY